jgi:preprotein translocase subunit SecF
MRLLENPNFEFLRVRNAALAVSAVLFAITIGSLVMKGGPNYSIDFTGGSIVQLRFPQEVPIDEIRNHLAAIGAGVSEIQRFGAPEEILVRVAGDSHDVHKVREALSEKWPGVELRREETVGPKVGGELRSAAIQSIILALFLILAYITLRFEFRWAVAAIAALVHDVVITVGALSVTDREMSLTVIAALLTIVGFSLNDTIVIFDRVRENLRVPTKEPFDRVLNRSINQTLMRTIITSGTVLLTVLALLFFGGEVLNDFAFAMTIGVVSGTYSTIYIATAVVLFWEQKSPRRGKAARVGPPAERSPRDRGKDRARHAKAVKA